MSAETRDPALQDYFREASAWDLDRCERESRMAGNARWVAVAACVCALVSSAALIVMLPLKRVEPFLIRVDSSTGVVDVVPVYAGQPPLEQAVTRYFLTHYVSVCERFNFVTAESDYEECAAFNGAQRNQNWYALWNRNNPLSPLNLHRDGGTVSVQIQAVSFLRRASGIMDTAQVRYLKSEAAHGGPTVMVSHWIATIQYVYSKAAEDPRMRIWNPLGFRVLEFVSEAEAPRESSGLAVTAVGNKAP
jgi:type IV secretion system protein VirB8